MEPGQAQVDMRRVVEVEIGALSVSDSPRVAGANQDHVEMLAVTDTPLPPIIAHRDTLRVIDGMHRLRAAERRGQSTIGVRFFEGDEADAFVLAVESNAAHGLPLTKADRKAAAARIISSHPLWSNRMIASTVGMAPATVAKIRRQLPSAATTGDGRRGRVGQDGRFRPLDGAEGRRLAGDLIAADPGLSLRQIARAAGISPETARDVRNRVRRGEDPLLRERDVRERGGKGTGHRGRADATGRAAVPPGETDRVAAYARMPVPDRKEAVNRLKGDPALRYNDTGRTLLRLLGIHAISTEEWDEISAGIPQNCRTVVAQLARDCSDSWSQLARRAAEHHAAGSVGA
ncbi:streptomycin biosynthesis protein [Streptomyces sp. NPDC017056]|uniref:streptomycin biosynthesis protein n=1 Tax=Streptomyces sp. NPDC017056 TaxID=3364973 RepID=UPI0037A8BF46